MDKDTRGVAVRLARVVDKFDACREVCRDLHGRNVGDCNRKVGGRYIRRRCVKM